MEVNKSDEDEMVEMSYEEFLLQSARFGDYDEVIMCLKDENINPNCCDALNNTPSHMAAANGHLEILRELIAYGANINAKNKSDNTPLHWASLNGHIEVVKLLLQHKADTKALNSFGKTPIDEAIQNSRLDVMEIFSSAIDVNTVREEMNEEDVGEEVKSAREEEQILGTDEDVSDKEG